MNAEDRLLFLRYALPCAGTLVRRGKVSQDYVNSLIRLVSEDKLPPEGTEKMFIVASTMCSKIANRLGKAEIDQDVIRTYFLFEHGEVVDDRFALMKDFNPVDCKTYPGKVIDVEATSAVVETNLGSKAYSIIFAKGVKPGNSVVVHYDYIIEKISEDAVKRMNVLGQGKQ